MIMASLKKKQKEYDSLWDEEALIILHGRIAYSNISVILFLPASVINPNLRRIKPVMMSRNIIPIRFSNVVNK